LQDAHSAGFWYRGQRKKLTSSRSDLIGLRIYNPRTEVGSELPPSLLTGEKNGTTLGANQFDVLWMPKAKRNKLLFLLAFGGFLGMGAGAT